MHMNNPDLPITTPVFPGGLSPSFETRQDSSCAEPQDPILPTETRCSYRLSFAQERIWFWDQVEPHSPLYNLPIALRMRGEMDLDALRKSLGLIVARHQALRTTFVSNHGRPSQVIHPARAVELAITNISLLADDAREEEVQRLAKAEARRPFDLSRDLMMRAALFQLAPREHVLLLTMHHIASDGWSFGILLRELSEAYGAYTSGRSPSLPELPVQYADFAIGERERLHGEVLEGLLSFWKKRLAGNPEFAHLSTDRPRPPRQTYCGAQEKLVLPEAVLSSLTRLSEHAGASLFMTLLAAFQTLLHRYSGHDEILVGFPIATRNRGEVADLIGFFTNTLVFRGDLSGNPTFLELLSRIREATLNDYLHQDLPFEKLVGAVQPERSPSQTPLFQTMFVFQNSPMPLLKWPGLTVSRFEVETETAKFDLTVFIEKKDGLKVTFEYNTGLFDAATMQRMLQHYRTLLEAVVMNPESRIGSLSLLAPSEHRKLVVDWNQTQSSCPQRCVHDLFQEQAERNPNRVALVFKDQQLTYRELNRKANALAHRLCRLGVTSEAKVGVLMARSPELVIALLGILKAGGAYVPLDPEYPAERLTFIMKDAGVRVLICQERLSALLPESGVPVLCLDRLNGLNEEEERTNNTAAGVQCDSLAYVMYTSGSTGMPKGVEISHRGIVRLIFGQTYARFSENEVFLQLAPVSFDASTFEIWGSLLHGARCVLFPGRVPAAHELDEVIRKHQVTILWLTAPLFNAVIDEAPEALSPLRQLLIGGDALSVPHVRRALTHLPHVELINGYGPTENTTFTCTYRIPKQMGKDIPSIPIGRPIANTTVYILDRYLQPAPIGVPGELYIGGAGLARGYLNRPELTAEKFGSDPFAEASRERLYRTGDIVRYLPDGNIEFLGRRDNQVKVRGFRIELGEIEGALKKHPEVREVAVVVHADAHDTKYLVAYVVPQSGQSLAPEQLLDFLKRKMPEYMLPQFVFLPSLPLLPSGKLDRRALKAPASLEAERQRQSVAPRDATESELVNIWEQVLGSGPVGINDNFFDLGGHSLLAVRLFSEIERIFGKQLDLSTLMSAPTVAQLAASLRNGHAANSSLLVPIQRQGSRPPLYCIHGGGGHVLRLRDLALGLGPDQPMYGLRAPVFNGYHSSVSVERLAEIYVQEIRKAQPEGPYYLAGPSFGGLIAYEMATQLAALGEEVALLVLFDTGNQAFGRSLPFLGSLRFRASRMLGRMQYYRTWFLRTGPKVRGRLVPELCRSAWTRIGNLLWRAAYTTFRWSNRPLPNCLRDNLKVFTRAAKAYRPKPYPGRVVLFKAEEQEGQYGPDPTMGWGGLARGGVEIHVAAGDHTSMFRKPQVYKLGEQLRARLEAAQRNECLRRQNQSAVV